MFVDDLDQPAWRVSTKAKAREAALAAARDLDARLAIETRDGRVTETHDFGGDQ